MLRFEFGRDLNLYTYVNGLKDPFSRAMERSNGKEQWEACDVMR